MKTGFGRNAREVLTRLHKAGYEIIEFAAGGIRDGSPESKAFPWKVRGVIPQNDAEFQHIVHDQNLVNKMAHGHFLIDRVIKEEKPDLFIGVEDIWHLSDFMFKPWFNKIPCILWTPIDSEPMLPIFPEQKSKFKNLWVKAEFAQEALGKLGVESKVVPCLIDPTPFKPIPDADKQAIKKSLGLEDTFIVGFLFRNQVRKLVVTLMEEFKEFQMKYPDSKAKLLLHTNFSEPGGWNIPLAAKELGIDMADILTTYVCRKCRKAQVIPFHGQELTCGGCKTEKALVNIGIDCGVTEDELNIVYNLMDCYAHPVTSGGHEVPVQEAMLAGVPCGTVNYAFGETYVNGGAFAFNSAFYREHTSHFKKSQPLPGEILRFIEDVYNNRDLYKQKGLEQRAWALDYFDPDKHAKFIIEQIEALPPHNYDFDFYDTKDVDFPPDYSISDNSEFVIHLYSGIFGVEVDVNNPDVIKCCQALTYQPREHIVSELKKVAAAHNERQKPVSVADFIIKSDKKKVCFVEPGKLTECFVALSVLEGLKQKYPLTEWDHYVSCQQENMHVFAHCDWIKNILPFSPSFDQPFVLEGRAGWPGFFDVALQPYMTPNWIHNGLD